MAFKPAVKAAVGKVSQAARVVTGIRRSTASQRQRSQARIDELHERRVELEKKAHERRTELERVLKESKRQQDVRAERELRRIIDSIERDIRRILKQITQEQERLIKLAFSRIDELAGRTDTLVGISHGLKSMVYVDPLTKLGNRKALGAEIEKESKRALRGSNPNLAVIFIDMDGLKWANDNFGHDFGDSMLKKVGDVLRTDAALRVGDFAGRLAGDEFVVIMPNTSRAGAQSAAHRILEMLNPDGLNAQELKKEKQLKDISVSFGVAALDEQMFANEIGGVSYLRTKIKDAISREKLERKEIEIGKMLIETADRRMQEHKNERKTGRE